MALITQNFRLNALANQYASALYSHICATSADAMLRGTSVHNVICGACAEICRQCADACDAMNDPEMARCAEACRRCAESCSTMAA